MTRAEVKAKYGALYDEVSALIFADDPIGLEAAGAPTDEYEPEVDTILPRLATCTSALDVRRVLHEEFVRWFDASLAGPEERFEDLSHVIWRAWSRRRDGA